MKMETTRQILERYQNSGETHWSHSIAVDPALTTDDLVLVALEDVRARRATNEDVLSAALIVLNERSTSQKAAIAHDLLTRDDAAERELGARLMREFCRLDHAPSSYSEGFVVALARAAENETDTDALWWELSAIGWQKLSSGRPTLLAFAQHDDDDVRQTIANNLWLTADVEGSGIPSDVMEALLKFASDPAPNVRSCVLYDVAAFPGFFQPEPRWLQVCKKATEDASEDVREWAEKAVEGLISGVDATS
ncbi:MAG: hypothetical protein GY822_22500 [Deltaproteobacteria bacterium]|nr:hypothetical protein [Deltaproteobacteria bacterium]